MQNFGVTNKEHYGMLYFWSGQLCSSKTYPTPPPPRPPGGHFRCSFTTPLGFSIPRVLVISPTPWNFRNFPFWLGSPRKEYFRQKCRCTILLCERQPAIKREKIFSFMLTQCQIISILPFGDLSQLIINGKSLWAMEAVRPNMTQVMSSLEPVNFN